MVIDVMAGLLVDKLQQPMLPRGELVYIDDFVEPDISCLGLSPSLQIALNISLGGPDCSRRSDTTWM